MRDFVVHSDGVVSFKSANAAAVSWRGLRLSPSDNGRQIMRTDLHVADFLALMLELDAEMTRLGFP